MASVLKVDKLDPQSGTALEIGTSGDTISVPSGATLDISASTLTPPATMPASSGINFTALNATNLGSGTVPTARLGTGTASSTTILYGDQTYKTEPSAGTNGPAFSAWSGASQALTADTWTKVSANTEVFDSDGKYNSSSYIFTPATTGNYLFFGTCYFQSLACLSSYIAIYKNGSRVITSSIFDGTATTVIDYPMPTILGAIDSNDTDYFEFYVYSMDASVNAYGDSTRMNWTTSWGAWKVA
jgi:hypothetical protein